MPIFRCVVRGANFPFLVDGVWKSKGFYTTRFVEAPTAEAAEEAALELLRDEDVLQRDPSTPGLEHANVFFEEIEQVEKAAEPNAGFTFFDEDES